MEVVWESLKVFIPCKFILQRGVTLKELHTHIHIFKSLKNTSAIGFGVNMVHGHEEDASFKKCRITLLQLIYGAGRGSAHGHAGARVLQVWNTQHYSLELN